MDAPAAFALAWTVSRLWATVSWLCQRVLRKPVRMVIPLSY
jgi:hypothetical protein